MLTLIKKALRAVWNLLKRIVLHICRFFANIVKFFRNPSRLEKLRQDENLIAVAIKENLDSGNYQVVECLFNKETGNIVNPKEDAQIIEAEDLDTDTERQFNGKEMVILK